MREYSKVFFHVTALDLFDHILFVHIEIKLASAPFSIIHQMLKEKLMSQESIKIVIKPNETLRTKLLKINRNMKYLQLLLTSTTYCLMKGPSNVYQ